MRKLVYIGFLSLFSLVLKAQFEVPRLSQYLNNGLVNNPAYAGSREALSFTGVGRSDYAGFEGSPTGFLAALHSPIKKGNVALGISVENKSYPGYSNTGVYTHYAFRTWLGGMRLSLGLRAGLYNYSLDYSGLDLKDPLDGAFESESGFAPNFGTGVYLYNSKFFWGLSVPYLLNLPDSTGSSGFAPKSYRYLMTTGYLFDISEDFKLKTTAMAEYSVAGLDLQGGVNFILFNDKIWLGSLYRTTSKTITSILEVQVTDPMRLGIAYDYSFSNIRKVSSGSFELMFRYEFNFVSNIDSPFYF
ncbi:MAG: PorP/SprF family type IX secretion system membrane protein [Bacteroidales bacterium]|nr:PorP/SprF family type IX secretion system membrane protein [Bacteroidales bacterium]MCF8389957.1 PorP/SprF family type IX secretion system membrane protein [Bacteroidales bacterium]